MSDKQILRSELGKSMGLDVGPPHELVQLATGDTRECRDALGLLVDPGVYAKRSCDECYGRGVITKHNLVPKREAEKMMAETPGMGALLHESGKGYAIREAERCQCAVLGYAKAFKRYNDALLQQGLAVRRGWTRDNSGIARELIELV